MEYEGQLKDNKPHGWGIKRWPDGNWYEGDFAVGLMSGTGSYFWTDASSADNSNSALPQIIALDMLQGKFENDKPHGDCMRYSKDGGLWEETWENGVRTACKEVQARGSGAAADAYTKISSLGASSDVSQLTPVERAKLQALLGGARQQGTKLFVGHNATNQTIGRNHVKATVTLVFQDCHDCTYTIDCMSTKIAIQGCTNCQFTVNGRVVTSMVEFFRCDNTVANINTTVKSLLTDMCNTFSVNYSSHEHMQDIVWAGAENLNVVVESPIHGRLEHASGFEQVKQQYKQIQDENKAIEQFFVRIINGKLLEERVVRLANGFPTTEREARDFNRRQEMNVQQLAKEAGITIGRKQKPVVTGRNDPCVCGSGKKYKKCCGVGGE